MLFFFVWFLGRSIESSLGCTMVCFRVGVLTGSFHLFGGFLYLARSRWRMDQKKNGAWHLISFFEFQFTSGQGEKT